MFLNLSNCRMKSLFGEDKALKVFVSRSTLLVLWSEFRRSPFNNHQKCSNFVKVHCIHNEAIKNQYVCHILAFTYDSVIYWQRHTSLDVYMQFTFKRNIIKPTPISEFPVAVGRINQDFRDLLQKSLTTYFQFAHSCANYFFFSSESFH